MQKDQNVIVITGASSGFGALAARALARAGHTVYASMRETTGRNAPQVPRRRRMPLTTASISAPSSSMSPPRPPPPLRSNRSSPRTVAWTW